MADPVVPPIPQPVIPPAPIVMPVITDSQAGVIVGKLEAVIATLENFAVSKGLVSSSAMSWINGAILGLLLLGLGVGAVGVAKISTPNDPVLAAVTAVGQKLDDSHKMLCDRLDSGEVKSDARTDKIVSAIKSIVIPAPVVPTPVDPNNPVGPDPTKDNPIVLSIQDSSGGPVPSGNVKVGQMYVVIAKSLSPIVWCVPDSKGFQVRYNGQEVTLTATMEADISIGGVCLVDGAVSAFAYKRITSSGKGPQPTPDPPPSDPFQAAVQAAYVADGKPAAASAGLAALYKVSGPTVDDTTLLTYQGVFSKMHAAAEALAAVGPNNLVQTRKVISAELTNQFGTQNKPIDAAGRVAVKAAFLKIQTALEACK